MINSHHPPVRSCVFVLLLILSSFGSVLAWSQENKSAAEDPERRRAFELYEQNNYVDAAPLLEKLAVRYPDDIVVLERWAFSLANYSSTLTDVEARKRVRMRARSIALQAKEHGDNSNLLTVMLESLPEDGSEHQFSDRKELNEVMQRSEASFARGEMDKAREGYMQALLLDPHHYEAALFTGDVFFKQHKPGFAGEWFARAIQIDPNRETAYRYWGDALMSEGKTDEARTKFIEAVIAEPYRNNSWMGLTQWADRAHVKLNYLKLQDKSSVKIEGKTTNITLDADAINKKDNLSGAAWLAYGMNRALWQNEDFKKEYPKESKYRRTLREELSGLEMMVSVISEQPKAKKKELDNLDPALIELVQIKKHGWLEPFVLLNRADAEIAQDYEAYRAANREKLRSYLNEYVVPKTPAK